MESWSDRAINSWRIKPRLVVHGSAASIPDRTLRRFPVMNAGDVQAFYNSADRSIHILADQIATPADAERLIRHEGMHWVFDGPMRQEYLDILGRVAKSIPEARIRRNFRPIQKPGTGSLARRISRPRRPKRPEEPRMAAVCFMK